MPSVLTHDFFGREAYGSVARELGFSTTDEMDAFLLGNQGPDPLLYLAGDPLFDARSRVGGLMHDEKPTELLLALRTAIEGLDGDGQRICRAYAAGFLCHYLLDRTAHPLIFAQQHAICASGACGITDALGSTVHVNIERELDEMMLFRKRRCTVEQYKPYEQVLHGSAEVLAAIDLIYERAIFAAYGRAIAPNAFSMSVRLFRLANRLFFSPKGGKRAVIGVLERAAQRAPLSFFCGMSHRAVRASVTRLDNHEHARWQHPFLPASSTDSFLDLYDRAQSKVLDAERAFLAGPFTPADARALTEGLNFSGAPAEA